MCSLGHTPHVMCPRVFAGSHLTCVYLLTLHLCLLGHTPLVFHCVAVHLCLWGHTLLAFIGSHIICIYFLTLHLCSSGHTSRVDRLVGLGVKASASRAEDPGFKSRLCRDFSGSSDLKIGTPVASLPGAWRYRVSAGTGWPGVSTL